jgi:hypothetical protein
MKEFLGVIAVGLLVQGIYSLTAFPREARRTWRTIVPLSLCAIIFVVVVYLGLPQSWQGNGFTAMWIRLCHSAAQNLPALLPKL